MTVFFVALGGAIGAALRFLSVGWVMRLAGPDFPYGTMLVNILGSLIMGIAAAVLLARAEDVGPNLHPFLLTGILGGFTTFSAFSLDAFRLLEQGRAIAAGGYVLGSVILSIGALIAGVILARSILT